MQDHGVRKQAEFNKPLDINIYKTSLSRHSVTLTTKLATTTIKYKKI